MEHLIVLAKRTDNINKINKKFKKKNNKKNPYLLNLLRNNFKI